MAGRPFRQETPSWKRSHERILTTHTTGSLPRPADLTATSGSPDAGTTTRPRGLQGPRAPRCCRHRALKQVEAGVDIVSDGEQGKVSYSTYVKHRLTGFEGRARCLSGLIGLTFPKQQPVTPVPRGHAPHRNRPLSPWKTAGRAAGSLLKNLNAALSEAHPEEAFMTAASRAVHRPFLTNEYYPSRRRLSGST